ncbi:hypothetical protein [Propionicimonas sp.]|uniref:hypothetical protein n=1 Tax=Propionicimonas sp. TaxID=1955623 RepID=UPI0017C3D5C9|nr:hypothetical protein [Propionicimonas sp.]MBU3977817.1 hypothetical protein [Actinomycetota bacterium]MBA3021739.1 hypothetical protein [Propionicimonas sp.]MBU3987291.1 hypothetical protein [Actinomycetota bacterium]MBU4009112.1 hypothetical protein [Actinomycetota bacterium]MBU4065738.1 hypothetical protein [Actinomycetota bacterium]
MSEPEVEIAPWAERLSLVCLGGSAVSITAAGLGLAGVSLGVSVVTLLVAFTVTALATLWTIFFYVVVVAAGRKRLLGHGLKSWRIALPGTLVAVAAVLAGIGMSGPERTPAPATPECATRILDGALGEYVCASPSDFLQAQLTVQMIFASVFSGALAMLAIFTAAIAAAMSQRPPLSGS